MAPPPSTILITGGTSGLGLQASIQLAHQCPDSHIVLASRSDKDSAVSTIEKATGHKHISFLPLDLSSLANVRTFATTYSTKNNPPLSTLLLSAGVQFPGPVAFNGENIEKTFAINHLGHALLFYLLRPHLSSDARIVITSSGTHDPAQKTGMPDAKYVSAEELAHPSVKTADKDGRQRYVTSKLCNILWTYALQKRLQGAAAGKTWTVNCFNPGLMPGTGLAREYPFVLQFLWNRVMPVLIPVLRKVFSENIHTTHESGLALARLGVSEEVDGISGKYFAGAKEIRSSEDSYDVGKQDDLWEWTLKHVAKDEDEMREFSQFGQAK
ncbi:hypothetical protein MMC28_005477 [Mycoblastus sanguinarius]|nr:hypothetical protein [Mycoblastus sanguinarius]